MNILILAAGKGVRMKSGLPKVLHSLAGRPMLSHVISTAKQLSPSKLIVVYGSGGDTVLSHYSKHTNIEWVAQPEQLGTGDAVKRALPVLDPSVPTLVLYGDVPCISVDTLNRMAEQVTDNRLVLLTAHLSTPKGYGRIIRDEGDQVQSIVEEKDATDKQRLIQEINTGIMLIPTHHLSQWLEKLTNDNAQGEYYLTDIVAMAVQAGVHISTVSPNELFEIEGANNLAQLAELERAYQQHLAKQLMTDGVHIMDPKRIDIRGNLQCGQDVIIDVGCIFEGEVTLGDRVYVGAHSVLRNTTVASGTKLEPFCFFESAQVGEDNKIGPFSRLRPGAQLSRDVHIGNFVEIKNAIVDDHSKVNHLSYIGDADVGKRVNIGAGTITCNYDGAYKHRTIIEDDAFIGSDTQLVAPVTVKQGATLGAGTTLTQDAPAQALTLSRVVQQTITDWKRPKKS